MFCRREAAARRGGVSERLKETVLKTVVAKSHREFESRPLRQDDLSSESATDVRSGCFKK